MKMSQDDNKKDTTPKDDTIEKPLTPWQKENKKYLGLLDENGESTEDSNQVDSSQEDELDETAEKTSLKKTAFFTRDKDAIKELPKSISYADKLPRMKENRKKRLTKRLIAILSFFGITAAGMIYYVSPLSKLNKVEVVGNDKVSNERVAEAIKVTKDDHIWAVYSDKTLPNSIKKNNPQIHQAKIKLSGINNLKVIVKEYKEVAYQRVDNQLFPVLENGDIIQEREVNPNNSFPILIDFKKGKSLDSFVKNYHKIDKKVNDMIKEIHATPSKSNPYLMTLYMKDGNEVLASTKDYFQKLNYYPQISAEMEEKGVIDMEAGVFSRSFESIEREKVEKIISDKSTDDTAKTDDSLASDDLSLEESDTKKDQNMTEDKTEIPGVIRKKEPKEESKEETIEEGDLPTEEQGEILPPENNDDQEMPAPQEWQPEEF
ncbi:cell division protein FtsQ/DivIB [Vagococcus intermedius]|uniref:Cell division protein DivIB n=1 Tax=Vagococcus intermedius TaxID=2991418 RepID=A0AAF0I863_9ENTE|nr:cell division protein FtsQ/DivIB [Vagococcus intermedius]WEG73859.1 cell division protein FtsQ/DivIB [Vagococcus intermedius]WEG75944.1 cell division protein FtsQ/DivIB [Vagococcus intermedius]